MINRPKIKKNISYVFDSYSFLINYKKIAKNIFDLTFF